MDFFVIRQICHIFCKEDIFCRILKARAYDSETERKILEAKPENLITFVKLILEIDNPKMELYYKSRSNLISEYCKIKMMPSDE